VANALAIQIHVSGFCSSRTAFSDQTAIHQDLMNDQMQYIIEMIGSDNSRFLECQSISKKQHKPKACAILKNWNLEQKLLQPQQLFQVIIKNHVFIKQANQ
jgi:hypothetical protein